MKSPSVTCLTTGTPQVLFNDEQYPTLPYTRYEATTVLAWGPARSLATETDVWVRPTGGAPP